MYYFCLFLFDVVGHLIMWKDDHNFSHHWTKHLIAISMSQNIETGLQALMGYIYGLRMDLIGQSDGVGLYKAFD